MSLDTKVDKLQDDITEMKVALAKSLGRTEADRELIKAHEKYISKAKTRGAVFLGASMGGGVGFSKLIEWFQHNF